MGVFYGMASLRDLPSASVPREFQHPPFSLEWKTHQQSGFWLVRGRIASPVDPPVYQVGRFLVTWDGTLYERGWDFRPFRPDPGRIEELFQNPARELARLKGWFALLLYDPKAGRLLLATDWMGLRPVLFRWQERSQTLAFGTWILPLAPGTPDPAGLLEYFFLNYPLHQRTLHQDFQRLPAGHFLLWETAQAPEVFRYYDHRKRLFEVELRKPPGRRQIAEAFVEATRALARDTERVGLLLTGGFDSRAVLAALRRPPALDVVAITFGDPASRNVATARRVARVAGAQFHLLDPNPVFQREFARWAHRNIQATDGLETVTKSHYLWGLSALKSPPPVLLSGTGGSELFRQTGVLGNIYAPLLLRLLSTTHPLTLQELAQQPQAYWLILESLSEGLQGLHQDLSGLLALSPEERVAFFPVFNLAELFPRYFENEMRMEQWFTVKRFPFLDLDLVELVFSSAEVSPLRAHLFRKSRWAPLRRLGFYGQVLRQTVPALARVETDRGIRPDYAWSPWGFLRSAWGYWRYRHRRGPGEYRFGEWFTHFPLEPGWPCEPPVRRRRLADALRALRGTPRPLPPGASRALTFCLWEQMRR